MNKEELLEEFDKRQKTLRDEFIAKLEDDKKEFKLTYPEDGETVYYIGCADGSIYDRNYCVDNWDDKYMFEHGLYFKTKEEAEQHLKESKLIFKLKQWAKRKNDGWKLDWKDTQQLKHYIEIDMDTKEFTAWYTSYNSRFTKLPYFKSKEITETCVDEFGDEIKEVLC